MKDYILHILWRSFIWIGSDNIFTWSKVIYAWVNMLHSFVPRVLCISIGFISWFLFWICCVVSSHHINVLYIRIIEKNKIKLNTFFPYLDVPLSFFGHSCCNLHLIVLWFHSFDKRKKCLSRITTTKMARIFFFYRWLHLFIHLFHPCDWIYWPFYWFFVALWNDSIGQTFSFQFSSRIV